MSQVKLLQRILCSNDDSMQDSISSMLSSETGLEVGSSLVTNSVPAALVQPTYLLASPGLAREDVARVSSLMADRQEELTRALQD